MESSGYNEVIVASAKTIKRLQNKITDYELLLSIAAGVITALVIDRMEQRKHDKV